MEDVSKATFVLVHGAVVGSWCWRWVTPFLRAGGHDVHTPSLTGLRERVHLASPEVDLETHIQDVINVLHYEDLTDVIPVGWSYGGMIVAGVSDCVPERIGQLVYLDSDVPNDGDTSSPRSNHARLEQFAGEHGNGCRVPPRDTRAEPFLLSELPDEQRRWIAPHLTPHPLKTWTQPIKLPGTASSIPTTYIRRTVGHDPDDGDTQRQDKRIRSEPDWSFVELAERHAAPFSAREALAEALLRLE